MTKLEQPEPIISLNEEVATDLPLEELERRLEIEELETRGAMWTGCDCDCAGYTCNVNW